MKEVMPNIFVGSQADYEVGEFKPDEWSILLAAKEPWHRFYVQYEGRACSKDHPEYLKAIRDNKLILNLVDAPKSIFFSKDLIDDGLDFIKEELSKGKKVAIFCNEGRSRSASLALLYLVKHGLIEGDTLEDVETEFLKLYPEYNPGAGMRGFVLGHFEEYKR
jgi:hypothetical protein